MKSGQEFADLVERAFAGEPDAIEREVIASLQQGTRGPKLRRVDTRGQDFADAVEREASGQRIRAGVTTTHATVRTKGLRPDSREADFVFSTDAVDRQGDIVEQVWQLDSFRANPVVLFAHNSREFPIGRAKRVVVERVGGHDALVGTIEFATHERAEQAWKLVRDGFLATVSVGFIPHTVKTKTVDDRTVFVLGDNELVEVSVVPVPANPEAHRRAA